MIFRGLLGAGLIWLAAGSGPDLGLGEPAAGNGMLRQMADAWRADTIKSLADVRRDIEADNHSLVWSVSLVAGESDGEAAGLTHRLASAETP